MSNDGRAVANFVLDVCSSSGRPITNLALQKIVYFCHGWSVGLRGYVLVRHQFEAWKHGPVLQYLYRDFSSFDAEPITTRAKGLNPNTGRFEVVPYSFDVETQEFLRRVIGFYSRLKAGTLVELSHTAGGPWDSVWNHGGGVNPGMKIDSSRIADFFSSRPPPF